MRAKASKLTARQSSSPARAQQVAGRKRLVPRANLAAPQLNLTLAKRLIGAHQLN
mgnify:CR=1 FL=1